MIEVFEEENKYLININNVLYVDYYSNVFDDYCIDIYLKDDDVIELEYDDESEANLNYEKLKKGV